MNIHAHVPDTTDPKGRCIRCGCSEYHRVHYSNDSDWMTANLMRWALYACIGIVVIYALACIR